MVSVFDYYEYRIFLKDFYEYQKQDNGFFSYRYMARKVGMDSSFIIKVLQGQLHISDKKISLFSALCKLNEREGSYFDTLVHFTKAKTEKESKLYFEKLLNIKDIRSDRLTELQYEFFSKWYYTAIWSLLHFFPYSGDNKSLAARLQPAIRPAEARQAVKLLRKLDLVEQGDGGLLKPKGLNLTTGAAWQSLAVANYQQEMVKLSLESMARFPKKERDISTLTINIDEESLEDIREALAGCREQIKKITNRVDRSERTYQLNFQLFPLSKKREEV